MAISQAFPAAMLAVGVWQGWSPPWVIAFVVVQVIVVLTLRLIGPIADAIGHSRAVRIWCRVVDPPPSGDDGAAVPRTGCLWAVGQYTDGDWDRTHGSTREAAVGPS